MSEEKVSLLNFPDCHQCPCKQGTASSSFTAKEKMTMSLFFLGNEVILSPSAVVIYKLLWLAFLFLSRLPCASVFRTLSQNNQFSAFSV